MKENNQDNKINFGDLVSIDDPSVYEMHKMGNYPVIFHYDKKTPTSFTYSNWHENIEILCFDSGTATIYCGGEEICARAGDVVIIDSNMLHRVESKEQAGYHCIIIDGGFLRKNGASVDNVHFRRVVRDENVYYQCNNIANTICSDLEFKGAQVRAEVLELAVMLLRDYRLSDESAARYNVPEGIRFAIGYIRSNFHKSLAIDELSAKSGYSKYHFIREFRRATGYTPLGYINIVRIEQASRMLENSDITISEISVSCGFPTPSYFSKLFLRVRGVPPSRWRSETLNKKQ